MSIQKSFCTYYFMLLNYDSFIYFQSCIKMYYRLQSLAHACQVFSTFWTEQLFDLSSVLLVFSMKQSQKGGNILLGLHKPEKNYLAVFFNTSNMHSLHVNTPKFRI